MLIFFFFLRGCLVLIDCIGVIVECVKSNFCDYEGLILTRKHAGFVNYIV